MGFDVVRSSSDEPVTVTGVTLERSQGLKVAESYLMPLRHRNLMGVASSWPPRTAQATGGDWNRRVPAVGAARLGQARGVRDWNLVMKLDTDPAVATPRYQRLALQYTTAGRQYVTRNGTGLVVKRPC
jgi:hypothetical protein